MIDEKGNVTCDTCGKYLGNINGDGDYFALIRTKRCPECQAFFTKEKKRMWNQEKRRKDKVLKKETKDEVKELREIVEGLKEENELLHKRINQLKDEQFRSRISALESIVSVQADQKHLQILSTVLKLLKIQAWVIDTMQFPNSRAVYRTLRQKRREDF